MNWEVNRLLMCIAWFCFLKAIQMELSNILSGALRGHRLGPKPGPVHSHPHFLHHTKTSFLWSLMGHPYALLDFSTSDFFHHSSLVLSLYRSHTVCMHFGKWTFLDGPWSWTCLVNCLLITAVWFGVSIPFLGPALGIRSPRRRPVISLLEQDRGRVIRLKLWEWTFIH